MSFPEYFPRYMSAHTTMANRWLHVTGVISGAALVGLAIRRRRFRYVPAGALTLFGWAWIGHFIVERNTPAGFRNPILAIPGDLALTGLMLTGRWRALDRLSAQGARLRHEPPGPAGIGRPD